MLVKNAVGREMEISEDDYKRLTKNGLKLTVVRNYDEKASRIGVYLQRFCNKNQHCASDRIRGEWVALSHPDIELYRDGVSYEAVIFHIATDKIKSCKGKKILDICDPLWKLDKQYLTTFNEVDAIIASTEELQSAIQELTKTPVFCVGDGHYLPHYENKVLNEHNKRATKVVWFGHADNIKPVLPLLDDIKKLGLELTTIAERKPCESNYVKWDVKTYIEEISKHDFAILPKNGNYKSNNKDITALLSGIPVAKTLDDIKRLINPLERKKDLKQDLSRYEAKYMAEKYVKVIDTIRLKTVMYTAICGGYEKSRDDIICFTENGVDKFNDPVMNAKIYKVLPHRIFDVEYSIWMDGNIFPLAKKEDYLKLLGEADIALFRHPWRKCIYEEATPAKERVHNHQREVIDTQMYVYKKEGMPKDFGMAECGMIIRRHNPITEEFNNRWWAEISRFSHRDQLSFPYVLWTMKGRIKVKYIEGNVRNHKLFEYRKR